MRQILRSGPVAVFFFDGDFHSVRADRDLASDTLLTKPQTLVGIYDKRCSNDWIIEDFEYVEQQYELRQKRAWAS